MGYLQREIFPFLGATLLKEQHQSESEINGRLVPFETLDSRVLWPLLSSSSVHCLCRCVKLDDERFKELNDRATVGHLGVVSSECISRSQGCNKTHLSPRIKRKSVSRSSMSRTRFLDDSSQRELQETHI